MSLEQIVAALIAERDRLNRAIEALGGGQAPKRRGRPPKNPLANAPDSVTGNTNTSTEPASAPARKKRNFSPAQRKAAAERMRQMWVKKKAAAKKAAK